MKQQDIKKKRVKKQNYIFVYFNSMRVFTCFLYNDIWYVVLNKGYNIKKRTKIENRFKRFALSNTK